MQTRVATLRCPSCGAPASQDAGRCAYCLSRLATIGCPACMALLFDGAAFCPSCGTPRSRSEDAKPQLTKCPACRGDMCWIRIGSVDLLECTTCDGTWIESRVFEELCARREQQSLVVNHPPSRKASTDDESPGKGNPPNVPRSGKTTSAVPTHADRVRYRPCPQCGKMMNRQNFGRLSGTIVDTCRNHGTFLDRGELHQIVQFILDGGFDRMRQAELQRLQEEQQRLKALELHLSRGRGDGLGT